MGNYRPFSKKFGTQTNTDMLSSKITKRKCAAQKQQKLSVKRKRYRFKKATLYEREVIKKQKSFIRW
jgi:hypothetical protein